MAIRILPSRNPQPVRQTPRVGRIAVILLRNEHVQPEKARRVVGAVKRGRRTQRLGGRAVVAGYDVAVEGGDVHAVFGFHGGDEVAVG